MFVLYYYHKMSKKAPLEAFTCKTWGKQGEIWEVDVKSPRNPVYAFLENKYLFLFLVYNLYVTYF